MSDSHKFEVHQGTDGWFWIQLGQGELYKLEPVYGRLYMYNGEYFVLALKDGHYYGVAVEKDSYQVVTGIV